MRHNENVEMSVPARVSTIATDDVGRNDSNFAAHVRLSSRASWRMGPILVLSALGHVFVLQQLESFRWREVRHLPDVLTVELLSSISLPAKNLYATLITGGRIAEPKYGAKSVDRAGPRASKPAVFQPSEKRQPSQVVDVEMSRSSPALTTADSDISKPLALTSQSPVDGVAATKNTASEVRRLNVGDLMSQSQAIIQHGLEVERRGNCAPNLRSNTRIDCKGAVDTQSRSELAAHSNNLLPTFVDPVDEEVTDEELERRATLKGLTLEYRPHRQKQKSLAH